MFRLSHFGTTQLAIKMLNLRKGHEPKKEIELPCHISFVWNLTLAPLLLRNGRDSGRKAASPIENTAYDSIKNSFKRVP